MKKLFYSAIFVLFAITVMAQGKYPVAKAYAYSQKEMSGINRKVVDKDGKVIRSRNTDTHFHLYLECYTGKEPMLSSIWINGKAYKFTLQKVASPVMVQTGIKGVNNTGAETLVPQTINDVLQVQVGDAAETKANRYTASLIKSNAVVFVYNYNGKKHYLAVKSLKEIAPEVNQ